jgi:lysophospholipase L1-like esterase
MFPRLAEPLSLAARPAVAEYEVQLPEGAGEAYDVVVEALPTQPITPQHALACGIAFDNLPVQTLTFAQHHDEHNPMWQQNVLRNAMIAKTAVRLKPGTHTLRILGIDPSVAVQRLSLTAAPESPRGGDRAGSSQLFSRKLPEGNHHVTITFGDDREAIDTTVQAESRRLMLERVRTKPGELVKHSFVVNIRTPDLPDGHRVRLNDRENGTATWDDRLTLEFLGPRPGVRDVRVTAAVPETITVYLAGDSTVTDQTNEPWAGWGQMLPRFFKPAVAVANHAESGRALRSFRSEKRLDKILEQIKSGDYLFIQFGHNDMKEKGEGVGPFTSYKSDLKQYVAAARKRGATPVIVTSMHRRRFNDEGKIENTFGDYIEAARQAAAEENVALIDLNVMSKTLYEAWGPEQSKKAFVHYPAGTYPGQDKPLKDDTHFNAYGAYAMARCVVEAIRTSDLPLKDMLAEDVTPFDPARPDPISGWSVPASPLRLMEVPQGK